MFNDRIRSEKMSMRFISLFLLTIVLLSACGPSQSQLDATATQDIANLYSTQTAQAPTATASLTPSLTATTTPTSTAVPTDTPTPSPTPAPLWMSAGLVLDDFPEGFTVMAPEDLSNLQAGVPSNAVSFGFTNESNLQVVMGYLIPYSTLTEQAAFDTTLPEMLDIFAKAFGATTTPEIIADLDDLGVAHAGSTFVAASEAIDLRWDNILFRRGEVGVMLFLLYPDGKQAAVPATDLAYLLDERISQALSLQATKYVSVWRDTFNNDLLEPWFWLNENPDRWNLSENPGFLRIYTSAYRFGNENGLLRFVAKGDFTIETHLLFEPFANFQFAGLVIYQDDQNILAFGRAFCDTPKDCVGNGIYFDAMVGGNRLSTNFATYVPVVDEAYLRLVWREGKATGLYSPDGVSWTEIGTHQIPADFEVSSVGLTASQNINAPGQDVPADFDYFELIEGE
jgi:regulation of enolase protein 1 (concanavalin A-like superfamily)